MVWHVSFQRRWRSLCFMELMAPNKHVTILLQPNLLIADHVLLFLNVHQIGGEASNAPSWKLIILLCSKKNTLSLLQFVAGCKRWWVLCQWNKLATGYRTERQSCLWSNNMFVCSMSIQIALVCIYFPKMTLALVRGAREALWCWSGRGKACCLGSAALRNGDTWQGFTVLNFEACFFDMFLHFLLSFCWHALSWCCFGCCNNLLAWPFARERRATGSSHFKLTRFWSRFWWKVSWMSSCGVSHLIPAPWRWTWRMRWHNATKRPKLQRWASPFSLWVF